MREIWDSNTEFREKIAYGLDIVAYKNTSAYKNKRIKQEQWMKNKGEQVLYITTEADYNKFTAPYKLELSDIEQEEIDDELEGLTNIQKWNRFLFGN